MKAKIGFCLFIAATFLLTACSGIGPGTVSRDRFDYTTAISESWKSQMLLNMVKLRYGDTPVFLDVTSVINSYELSGQPVWEQTGNFTLLMNQGECRGIEVYADRRRSP
jgi:hypothetical protein